MDTVGTDEKGIVIMLTGLEYEHLCAKYVEKIGFSGVRVTKGSADQGVDIVAFRNGYKYAIQCKYYNTPVGNRAIQEVSAGAAYYNCERKMVITNNCFTKSAIVLAESNDVELMPNITEEMISSYNNSSIQDISRTYSAFKHLLQSKEYYSTYLDYSKWEEIYKKDVYEIENNYKYLRRRNLDKYKPTNSYHSTSKNFFYGINDTLNRSIESFAKKVLEVLLADNLMAKSTRLRSEGGNLILHLRKNSSEPIDPIQIQYIQAHLNASSDHCFFNLEAINESEFVLTISKHNVSNHNGQYSIYNNLKNRYRQNLLSRAKILTYTDGYRSSRFFESLEEKIFENVAYYLYFSQDVLPVEYMLQPFVLLSAEYNKYNGQISFYYYCHIDLRFFKALRFRNIRKNIKVENSRNCVFQIKASIFIGDYYILQNELEMIRPISPSDMDVEFVDLNNILESHNPPLEDEREHIHPNNLVVKDDFDYFR